MSFIKDRRGVAALEFAFLSPVLILLICGMFELTYAFQMQANTNPG